MWQDSSELVVAKNGEVSFAPVGTALPTTPTEKLNSAFVGAGFLTEEGAKISATPEIMETKSWQRRQATRRDLNGQEITVTFTMQQVNESNLVLALGGGKITEPSVGIFRYDFVVDSEPIDERALVIDAADGGEHHRFVFLAGNVTESVELSFQRGQELQLPVTFKVLAPSEDVSPGYYLTDSDAFTPGS
ncbi:MAG TPA: hypothetical protein VFK14_00190 [Solirubrobacterales bacterium]|nr:hypothetical protein [Solirubrobacterales bacterium]